MAPTTGEAHDRQRQRQRRRRVVVTDERRDVVADTAALLGRLGHEVVAGEVEIGATVDAVRRHDADLAVIAVHSEPGHALELVEQVNDTASCPVVLLMDEEDPDLVARAADRGIVASAARTDPRSIESAIVVATGVFAELQRLGRHSRDVEAGAARRAVIERAKGVLMERHDVDEAGAYLMLQREARSSRRRLADIAEAVLAARRLLPERPPGADLGTPPPPR